MLRCDGFTWENFAVLFSCLFKRRMTVREWKSIQLPDLSVIDLDTWTVSRGFFSKLTVWDNEWMKNTIRTLNQYVVKDESKNLITFKTTKVHFLCRYLPQGCYIMHSCGMGDFELRTAFARLCSQTMPSHLISHQYLVLCTIAVNRSNAGWNLWGLRT